MWSKDNSRCKISGFYNWRVKNYIYSIWLVQWSLLKTRIWLLFFPLSGSAGDLGTQILHTRIDRKNASPTRGFVIPNGPHNGSWLVMAQRDRMLTRIGTTNVNFWTTLDLREAMAFEAVLPRLVVPKLSTFMSWGILNERNKREPTAAHKTIRIPVDNSDCLSSPLQRESFQLAMPLLSESD